LNIQTSPHRESLHLWRHPRYARSCGALVRVARWLWAAAARVRPRRRPELATAQPTIKAERQTDESQQHTAIRAHPTSFFLAQHLAETFLLARPPRTG